MPKARPGPDPAPVDALPVEDDRWPLVRVRVPPAWKVWLEEAAAARAMSVADLVRQCIRALMITRHDNEGT